jgi:rRNA small subunit pseudouridine methyltransferase Nep1
MGVGELVRRIAPDVVLGLSVQGKMMLLEELAEKISTAKNPCVIVGGFPHGHFSKETLAAVNQLVRIHAKPLEAHVVASRVIYEAEKAGMGSTIKSAS